MSNSGLQENENRLSAQQHVWYIRNMVCSCCLVVVRQLLEQNHVEVLDVNLGRVKVRFESGKFSRERFDELLKAYGLSVAENREEQLVLQIKTAVIELVHEINNMDSIVRKSDYLVEKLGFSYPYLSKHFSDQEGITLEKYIIHQKIERIKQLLDQDEYSLSEIAFMMDYSSVQYLSNQFRQVTGITVSEYKKSNGSLRLPIDAI